ncbi:DUF4185 domain-containing protein [Blastococcus sp. TML/M2B]|uniref:DUF4185 domain-containing protein n=1 Tax=unclassified Blastococcus TaxID=2619396 RepID=UPI00190DAEB9|nr:MULTISPECIES: DUF4185 domain-containing protein [unclassified Blastococcus]MBN1092976.1 DUF4185 domain-containing protein [Blastococcus sp. TML/M2B]MBN1096918.1 DUF4185 domain-containing protein [Blastococcus sp. TML/C7B]
MLRRSAVLLPVLCLVLTGCIRLEAPAPEVTEVDRQEALPTSLDAGEAAATTRLEPACPAPDPAEVVSATTLNRALSRIDFPQWQSADLGATVALADGRIFWAWGDTGRERDFVPQLVDNSVLISSGNCFSQLLTDEDGPFFQRGPDELTLWPMSVVRLDPTPADGEGVTDVVLVYQSRIQRGDRQWDFLFRGTSVAVLLVGADGVPRLDRTVQLTTDSSDYDQVNWGAAAEPDGEWIYLYGTRYTAEAYITGRELYVSRVPLSDPTNAAAQEFWDGTGWQDEPGRAAPMIGAVQGTSQTLSVDQIDGRWVIISKEGGDLADWISMWTSDSPTGPWSDPVPVLSSPAGHDAPAGSRNLQYTPLSHPDIRTQSGALLVSVSRNTDDIELLFDEPQRGRVLFAEVPLPRP